MNIVTYAEKDHLQKKKKKKSLISVRHSEKVIRLNICVVHMLILYFKSCPLSTVF